MSEKTRILLVEDDENLGYVIKDNLIEEGYEVHWVTSGNLALDQLKNQPVDICLLDVMLPGRDGFELCQQIRRDNEEIPILFITARGMQEDRIQGFELGGDDYITKPFSIKELIMRIEVFRRRSSQPVSRQLGMERYEHNGMVFDHRDLSLHVEGTRRSLTQMEADLLGMLLVNRNVLLRREDILRELWGDDDYFKGRSLDVFITKLRKYLKGVPSLKIQNHHGIGFKLTVQDG